MAFLGLLIAGYQLARRSEARLALGRHRALFLALVGSSVAHWLLHPLLGDRFFSVLYVCLPLALLSMATRFVASPEFSVTRPG